MAPKNPQNDPQQERPIVETDTAHPGLEQAQTVLSQTASASDRISETALAAADFSALAATADATDSDITDEMTAGGPAFGAFVKSVGLAVAEAQKELDKSLVATAKELSDTQIDVIAIFEQVINDEGEMTQGNVIKQKLPLINYLMPTAYQWSRVYLEADMTVSEFNSANGFNIKKTKVGIDASAGFEFGLGGIGVSGSNTNSFDYSNVNTSTATSVDKAAGSMHMEATLEPRSDIQLPRPFVLQKGPKLQLGVVASEDLTETDSGGAATPIGRKVTVEATLMKTDGAVHSGKTLQVSVDRNDLTFVASSLVTDAAGKVRVDIERRVGAAWDPATPRAAAVVRISFGLVTSTLGISI